MLEEFKVEMPNTDAIRIFRSEYDRQEYLMKHGIDVVVMDEVYGVLRCQNGRLVVLSIHDLRR